MDGQGYYVAPVLLEEGQAVPAGCIEQRPQDGFHAPKWAGSEWTEGKSEPEILEGKKASKVGELAGAAIDELAPLFTPGAGRDETALLVASHVLKLCEALNIEPDPRLAEVVSTGEKALQKKAEVEQAATPEEVEEVSWT